jgi:aerobic carbon-monoxide dehydrogenase small subunit
MSGHISPRLPHAPSAPLPLERKEFRFMKRPVSLTVNGTVRAAVVEPRALLVHVLRDDFNLTGTHIGCDTSQCGACTVLIDGLAVKSCTQLAVQCEGQAITTIEGIGTAEALHPIQAAFWEKHGLQCGFCTPGMILTAVDFLARNPDPSEKEIRHGLEGNYCRCTGYQNIVAAVQAAAKSMRAANASSSSLSPLGAGSARPQQAPVSSPRTGEPAGAGV